MEVKIKFFLFKAVKELLAIVLAVSIVVLSSAVVFTACFQSNSFIKKNLDNYSEQTISIINDRFKQIARDTDFPEEAYINALTKENTSVIFDKVIESFNFNYSTQFADDSDVYDLLKAGMTNYCHINNIDVSENEICLNASLAVDAINEVMGGSSTANIKIMILSRSKKMAYSIIVPAVLIVACIIILDNINRGRHRKFNYIGMGFSISGFVMTFATVFALIRKYISNYKFCDNVIYNSAIRDIVIMCTKMLAIVGAVCIVIGFVMLVRNYVYYSRRKQERNERLEHNEQMRFEYLEEYQKKNPKESVDPNEKVVSKIEFGDE